MCVAAVLLPPASLPTMAEPADNDVAQAAVTVFFRGCLGTAGQQSSTDAWLVQHGFRPASSQAAVQLTMGQPGNVWINGYTSLVFAVVTRPAGISCQVMAPAVDEVEVTQLFRHAVAELARPGFDVRSTADEDVKLGDRTGRRVSYRVGSLPLDADGFDLVLTVAPPHPGGVSLLITLSHGGPLKPE